MAQTFKAMLVSEADDREFTRQITDRTIDGLPAGDVLIQVAYSSLNYKDALSATGNKGVTRQYPHTPGIDASGTVAESGDDRFPVGSEVLVTGYDLGMNTAGGFGQYIRVPADWVVALPETLSLKECMIFGTAGFTAAMSVLKLQDQGVLPESGEILVTGATGGVGSVAVGILATAGYTVVAGSGKSAEKQYLLDIGASEVVDREAMLDTSARPLLKGRWAGVVDTVGGDILATAIKSTLQHATVTCCGNVASFKLDTTVFPFILRGVNLMGVDSANCPMDFRLRAWEKLAGDWKIDGLDRLATDVSLPELDPYIDRILEGRLKGRTVVHLK
jgi:putative YhdH/YhfP family quinone oxidoreductase